VPSSTSWGAYALPGAATSPRRFDILGLSGETPAVLDLPRLERIRLTARPRGQRVVGYALLMPNYRLPPRVRIDLEGLDRLPKEPVIFAMNHTDRYNYWPFQYRLWRTAGRFTATWVKGKYYQNPAVAKFMELMNNIPTVSRGYLIARDFLNVMGHPPSTEQYETLRKRVRAAALKAPGPYDPAEAPKDVPRPLLTTRRNMLGHAFDPAHESWEGAVDALFRAMMRRFVELNAEAFDKGLDLLVFPQGTRSIRLSRGHIGLAQIALRYRRTVVPVGCNGSDRVYPGSAPVARGGHIVYRIGEPIRFEDVARYHIGESFEPFTAEAEEAHRERFQGLMDLVMERINELLDPPYQFREDRESEGVAGSSRFV